MLRFISRMIEQTDQQLIAAYQNGDEQAFTELVNRHLTPIYHFVYRLTGNPHEADDITQDTFFKVWQHLKNYRTGDNFKTWLYTIARRTAIDWFRKKKHIPFAAFENEEGDNALTETLADIEPLPDELAERAHDYAFVENLLARVPSAYREILTLHYEEGLTFEDIGRIVNKPLNTVKSQHRRALILLRTYAHAPK